jgi:hypothetical protein
LALEKYGGVYLDADIEILVGDAFRKVYDDCQDAAIPLFIGVESRKREVTATDGGRMGRSPDFPVFDGLVRKCLFGPLLYAIKNFDSAVPYVPILSG